VREATEALNVGCSTMDERERQLCKEWSRQNPKAQPMTFDPIKIRELENRIRTLK